MRCPYCKTEDSSAFLSAPRIVCRNCRYYHQWWSAERDLLEERHLLLTYRWLPVNWRDWDEWRNDDWYKP